MDRNQADRLFRRQRSQPLLDLAAIEAEATRTQQIDADEVAILGTERVGLGDVQFAAGLLLVDRDQASAAVGILAENSEHACLAVIDDLEDPSAIGNAVTNAVLKLFDPQQRAVADTGGGAGLRPPRNVDADSWRLAVFDLIPFGWNGDQLAVAVATGDIGQQSGRQGFGLADFLAAFLDDAFVRQLSQQLLQRDTVGIFEAELAGDLASPDLAGIGADEGDDGLG